MNIRGTSDHDDEAPQLKELMPVLDDAMSGLSSADREALLLRFFRGLSLRDTGAAMGTTEEAVAFVEGTQDVIALGVDTLTCWSTGTGGVEARRSLASRAVRSAMMRAAGISQNRQPLSRPS